MTVTVRLAVVLLVCLLLMAQATPLRAQSANDKVFGSTATAGAAQRRPGQQPPAEEPAVQTMEQRRLREANKQRQQQLQRDADRLLQLATELKLYVDKTNENVLSLNVIKKAEEIEKLAHSVKDKMKAD